MGRRILDLKDVRADGWFERLGDGAPRFRDLCDVLGEKVVAFAIVAGVRITAVAVERRQLDASLVTFSLGEGEEEHQMPLGELRNRLGSSLSATEVHPQTLGEAPSSEELQRFIGYRYLLLAPLFGIRLRELHLQDDGPASVLVDLGGAVDVVPLEELRDLVRERVKSESRGPRPASPPFSIDLDLVPKAALANERREFHRTVELLSAWPGPLSILLRTREGQELSRDVKAALARALGLLGTAHAELGNGDWAEEVLRLAIQWGQEPGGEVTGDLFRRLGETQVRRGRPGPAIGLLQRALGLGASRSSVLPMLARAFAARDRHLPAALCAEEAMALGVDDDELDRIFGDATRALGGAWTKFRASVAS
jgi:hypothetical protein